MKPLSSAIAAALILFSAQGVAEQTTQPVVTSCANVVVVPPSQEQPPCDLNQTVVVPPSQEQPPFDLNHMGTGSDKSDALGVPYYNQHAM
ncbi:multiple antibiotic resistance protein MarB [Escherichia coli]|nr:multiple antibiotic resistance regulatory protein MarB [Escherichia coli]